MNLRHCERKCALALLLSAIAAEGSAQSRAPEPGAETAQQRTEARGWLRLEQDQRQYREGTGPPSRQESGGLRRLENREALELRALQRGQRRELQTERRQASYPGAEPSAPAARQLRIDRDLQRQRQRNRVPRERLRAGPR